VHNVSTTIVHNHRDRDVVQSINRGRDVVHYPDRDRDVVHNVSTKFFQKKSIFLYQF